MELVDEFSRVLEDLRKGLIVEPWSINDIVLWCHRRKPEELSRSHCIVFGYSKILWISPISLPPSKHFKPTRKHLQLFFKTASKFYSEYPTIASFHTEQKKNLHQSVFLIKNSRIRFSGQSEKFVAFIFYWMKRWLFAFPRVSTDKNCKCSRQFFP